jgi:hypothetical protein
VGKISVVGNHKKPRSILIKPSYRKKSGVYVLKVIRYLTAVMRVLDSGNNASGLIEEKIIHLLLFRDRLAVDLDVILGRVDPSPFFPDHRAVHGNSAGLYKVGGVPSRGHASV